MRTLYLHGFASGPGSQKARYFRERFRERGLELETPDLAEGDFEGLTLSRQLALIERLARGEEVSLLGSSMGGYLAALYAARHSEARKLVLMAPAFGFARRFAELNGPERIEQWRRTGRLPVYHYAEAREAQVGWDLYEDALRYEEYPDVRQPVLLFHGLQDTHVPPGISEEFARGRPNVDLHLVDSDHELLSAVDEIWQSTCRFLDNK